MQTKLIKDILELEEWSHFECKRAKIKPEKLLETASALTNTHGGIIAIGLEDPEKSKGTDRLYGISEAPDHVSEILKLLDQNIKPPIPWSSTEIEIKNRNNKKDSIMLIRIEKSNDIHSTLKGDTWVRKGRQNTKIGAAEILRLKYEKGAIKYESEPSQISTLDNLDLELLEELKRDSKSKETNNWQFLQDIALCQKSGKKQFLNNAGALLFLKNPTIHLGRKCGIKISEYFGVTQVFSEKPNLKKKPISIEGPLLKQINEAISYFNQVVDNSPPELKGATFSPSLAIPEFAFQEAITNAVIHRNYTIQDDIQIRFFSDRIEIESPGGYPGHITNKNILKERCARNPLILRVLNKFKSSPNLDIGEGVNRMYQVMEENNLYAPVYTSETERPHSVLLILLNLRKTEYWDIVNEFLEKHKRITNKEARQITKIQDTNTMSRQLKSWVEQGLLEQVGKSKKSRYYTKPNTELI